MQLAARLLKSRQFALALLGVVTAAALLSGLCASGALTGEDVALLVLALYIGSKVFMLAAGLWLAARHSARVRCLFGRAAGK